MRWIHEWKARKISFQESVLRFHLRPVFFPFLLCRAGTIQSGDGNSGPIHETLYWMRENIAAFRHGPWKLIRVEGQGVGLFDLGEQLSEKDNLASGALPRAEEMAEELKRWMETMAEPNWHEAAGWNKKRAEMHSSQYAPFALPDGE